MTLLMKSVQMLRTFVMKTQTKPMFMCTLCLRNGHVAQLPLNFLCSSRVRITSKVKLFSTSAVKRLSLETRNKKKIVFSVPEARRLLSLAKPEKWKLFGKILETQNINDYALFTVSVISETKVKTWNLSQSKYFVLFSRNFVFEDLLQTVIALLHI